MTVVEFVEPGLCGTMYDVTSLSQRLISTINTSDKIHDHAEIEKFDAQSAKSFVSKECH